MKVTPGSALRTRTKAPSTGSPEALFTTPLMTFGFCASDGKQLKASVIRTAYSMRFNIVLSCRMRVYHVLSCGLHYENIPDWRDVYFISNGSVCATHGAKSR